jgi:hypothetical protein
MLFRKDVEHICRYCIHSRELNEEQLLCIKTGIVVPNHTCRHFSYDALKRVPPQSEPLTFDHFTEEDFSLD